MLPTKFSDTYTVRRLTIEDVPAVLALCQTNPLYYEYYPPAASEQTVLEDMTALPPGKKAEDKYFVGFYREEKLVAVLDLIDAYPDEKTAYIGFFMVDSAVSGKGVGTDIIQTLCLILSDQFEAIRLGYVTDNPQSAHFWQKNGFEPTGRVVEFTHCTVTVLQKELYRGRS